LACKHHRLFFIHDDNLHKGNYQDRLSHRV
jgi:hypothetical protein